MATFLLGINERGRGSEPMTERWRHERYTFEIEELWIMFTKQRPRKWISNSWVGPIVEDNEKGVSL